MAAVSVKRSISTRAWTRVILARKRDSRHSTTSFSENAVLADRSYKVLLVELFAAGRRKQCQFFLVKEMYDESIRGVYYLRIRENTLSEISYWLVVVLVLESKGL